MYCKLNFNLLMDHSLPKTYLNCVDRPKNYGNSRNYTFANAKR